MQQPQPEWTRDDIFHQRIIDENTAHVIGSNSNNYDLRMMVINMMNNANPATERREVFVEHSLGDFISKLVDGLNPDSIPSEISLPDYQRHMIPSIWNGRNWRDYPSEYFFTMASKIKRTIFNELPNYFTENDINIMNGYTPPWRDYMNALRSSYIYLYRPLNPSHGEFVFRVYIPNGGGLIQNNELPVEFSLDAYNILEFLTRIKFHIMDIAEEYYNIDPRDNNNAEFQPGGRKYKKRKSLKKKRKTKRKIKRKKTLKKRKK